MNSSARRVIHSLAACCAIAMFGVSACGSDDSAEAERVDTTTAADSDESGDDDGAPATTGGGSPLIAAVGSELAEAAKRAEADPPVTVDEIPDIADTEAADTEAAETEPADTESADTASADTASTYSTDGTLFANPELAAIVTEVAAESGGDHAIRIVVYESRVIAEFRNPEKPENVDEYTWNDGTFETPEPVRVSSGDDLDAAEFSPDDVRWDAIAELTSTAVEQTGIEGGEVTHLIVHRPLPFSTEIEIRVFVNGPRGSGFIDADAEGNVTEVNKG